MDTCSHQHSFSGLSSVFSCSYTSQDKRDQLRSYCSYQSHTLWLYVGIKILLHQGLQMSSKKAAFACVWMGHGALQEHSSALYFVAGFKHAVGDRSDPGMLSLFGFMYRSSLSRSFYQTY